MAKRKAPNTRCEILDDDLAELLGTDDCKMTEIRSLIKEYLVDEDLIEETDSGKIVHCDELLRAGLGIKKKKMPSKEFWFKALPAGLKTRVEYYSA